MTENTRFDVEMYYLNKAKLLKPHGFRWSQTLTSSKDCGGFYTFFVHAKSKEIFISFFVKESCRGTGVFPRFLKEEWSNLGKYRFITVPSCNLVDFFEKFEVPYLCIEV